MPPSTTRTPLRRVSQGSLSALARSGAYPNGPTGLEFLEPAMIDLADEAAALHANLEGLNKMCDALDTFNEAFASYLYAMRMNAFCVEWHQAPGNESFRLALREAERVKETAALLSSREATPHLGDHATAQSNIGDASVAADQTFSRVHAGDDNTLQNETEQQVQQHQQMNAKPKAKAGPKKMTAKERKERSAKIESVVDALPLEFRGQDPDLRRAVEAIITGLLDAGDKGVKILELVKSPELNQARVNKCLIALVNRKIVVKSSHTGAILYQFVGLG